MYWNIKAIIFGYNIKYDGTHAYQLYNYNIKYVTLHRSKKVGVRVFSLYEICLNNDEFPKSTHNAYTTETILNINND